MYTFIFGNHPELSVAELGTFFGDTVSLNPVNKIGMVENVLPAQFKDAPHFLSALGGTIEIDEVISERTTLSDLHQQISDYIFDHLPHRKEGETGKVPFAINIYPERSSHKELIRKLTVGVKKKLKENGIRSEFWNNDFRNINRVYAVKHHLIEKGFGITLLERGDDFMVTAMRALQDVDSYSERDYGKAARDSYSGMLPPKLAQILLNLGLNGEDPKTMTIFDPFCGTGTILMETLLRGGSTVGSDLNPTAVEQAKKNVAWLHERQLIPEFIGAGVMQRSALEVTWKDISLFCPDKKRMAVVSEPLLGPPMRVSPTQSTVDKVIEDLSRLYVGFFQNMVKVLEPGTRIVCIFPCWRKDDGSVTRLSENIVEKIERSGYSRATFVPLHTTSLVYSRPYSIVGREILRFVRV